MPNTYYIYCMSLGFLVYSHSLPSFCHISIFSSFIPHGLILEATLNPHWLQSETHNNSDINKSHSMFLYTSLLIFLYLYTLFKTYLFIFIQLYTLNSSLSVYKFSAFTCWQLLGISKLPLSSAIPRTQHKYFHK